MNEIKKITGYNLLIMLCYCFLFALGKVFFLSFVIMVIHFITAVILSLVNFSQEEHPKGKAYLLTSGILLLIGSSTCYGFLNGTF